eukprot:Hpha_TRINITY_DN15593_c5_g7::TRINITY_DN15593_c5_g7_i1::g.104862::m.104862/K12447/USP; UDP-sugar pyrophosphorylase
MAAEWVPSAGLSEEEERMRGVLEDIGQGHVFSEWPAAGIDDDEKRSFLMQCQQLDDGYPGGLEGYYKSAIELLASSARGENPLAGYTPHVPQGVRLFRSDPEYDSLTATGLEQISQSAFVLVAGGLGERLGFPGIKLSLPVETATGNCYLSMYAAALKAWGRETKAKTPIPLAIMTSDDTHKQTEDLLAREGNFGLEEGQVVLIKQGKVPALKDGAATFAVDPKNPYLLVTKPHGHGDVHQLLFQRGLAQKWAEE